MDPRDASASKKQGYSDGGGSVEQFKHKHKGNQKYKKKTAGIGVDGGVQQFLLFQSQVPFGSESETSVGQLTLKQVSHHFTLDSNNDKSIPKLSLKIIESEYFPVFK